MNSKEEAIKGYMLQYPVTRLKPNSKDHARHALEQALVDSKIDRQEYNELVGYVVQRMFR